jgi:hypothetical protein
MIKSYWRKMMMMMILIIVMFRMWMILIILMMLMIMKIMISTHRSYYIDNNYSRWGARPANNKKDISAAELNSDDMHSTIDARLIAIRKVKIEYDFSYYASLSGSYR